MGGGGGGLGLGLGLGLRQRTISPTPLPRRSVTDFMATPKDFSYWVKPSHFNPLTRRAAYDGGSNSSGGLVETSTYAINARA